MSFRPLDGPWGYAHEAIEAVERRNCSHGHGCLDGAERGDTEWREIGPGGTCGLLATISIGDPDDVIPEMDMDADGTVVCHSYRPRPVPRPEPEPIPERQLTID